MTRQKDRIFGECRVDSGNRHEREKFMEDSLALRCLMSLSSGRMSVAPSSKVVRVMRCRCRGLDEARHGTRRSVSESRLASSFIRKPISDPRYEQGLIDCRKTFVSSLERSEALGILALAKLLEFSHFEDNVRSRTSE